MPIRPEDNPKPFKKGQSGNPKGRPKKLPELDKLLADVLGDERNGMTAAEALLKKMFQKALAGDTKAANLLLDRAYGKALQLTETKITNVNPDKIIVKWQDDSEPGNPS